MATLNVLPEERLEQILLDAFSTAKEAGQLLLVCSTWKRLILPHMYREIYADPSSYKAIANRFHGAGGEEVAKFVKTFIAASGGMGSGLEAREFSGLLDLFVNVETVIAAHFWHQWFSNAIQLSANFHKVKTFIWHGGYSPLPNPNPAKWIGQFGTWESLERLEIRMLSFMDTRDPEPLPPRVPSTPSKLKSIRINGNFVPPEQLLAAVSTLKCFDVPLETLELANIGLCTPQGYRDALKVVGNGLKSLVIQDDGRLSAQGNVAEVLLAQLDTLCPQVTELMLTGFAIPKESFEHLPPLLTKFSAREDTLSAESLTEGLSMIKHLKDFNWYSTLKSWNGEETRILREYMNERGISGNVGSEREDNET